MYYYVMHFSHFQCPHGAGALPVSRQLVPDRFTQMQTSHHPSNSTGHVSFSLLKSYYPLLSFMPTVYFRYYDPPLQYCSRNSTPIQFRISSNMCIRGSCGKFGRCYQFFSGGNMFSTCTCFAGKAKKLSRPSLPAEKMLLSKLQSHSDAWHSQTFLR